MRLDQITVYRIVYRCVLAQDERTLLYRSCSCSLCCRFWLSWKKTGGEREREIRSPCGSFPEGSLQVPPSLHSPPDASVTQWTIRFGFILLFFSSSLPASVLWWCCCLFHMRDMRSDVEPMDACGRLSVSLLFFASACVFSTKAQLLFPTGSFAHRAQGALIHWRSLALSLSLSSRFFFSYSTST
jgi:hypothetical protein